MVSSRLMLQNWPFHWSFKMTCPEADETGQFWCLKESIKSNQTVTLKACGEWPPSGFSQSCQSLFGFWPLPWRRIERVLSWKWLLVENVWVFNQYNILAFFLSHFTFLSYFNDKLKKNHESKVCLLDPYKKCLGKIVSIHQKFLLSPSNVCNGSTFWKP